MALYLFEGACCHTFQWSSSSIPIEGAHTLTIDVNAVLSQFLTTI